MNSFRTNQIGNLFLLFFFTICVSSLIAPVIKILLDALLSCNNTIVVELLNFKNGVYDFGRVMRRILMATALIIILVWRKALMIGPFTMASVTQTRRWKEYALLGFLLSTGMLALYTSLLLATGGYIFHVDVDAGNIISKIIKILLIASLVGFIEEIFFRGYILQSMLTGLQNIYALCISSFFFSALHFFKTDFPVSPGSDPLIGLLVIYQSFKAIIMDLPDIFPAFVGLFLIGIALGYGYLRTKSLYFAIGLHTGWIFLSKTNRIFFDHVEKNPEWLFGDSKLFNGVLGWVLLLCTLVLIRFIPKTLFNGKNITRTL